MAVKVPTALPAAMAAGAALPGDMPAGLATPPPAPAVRVHLHIGRRVLPAMAVSARDHFAAQLQAELARRLAAPGLAAALHSRSDARLRQARPALPAAGETLPAALAEHIVAAICGQQR